MMYIYNLFLFGQMMNYDSISAVVWRWIVLIKKTKAVVCENINGWD